MSIVSNEERPGPSTMSQTTTHSAALGRLHTFPFEHSALLDCQILNGCSSSTVLESDFTTYIHQVRKVLYVLLLTVKSDHVVSWHDHADQH